MTTQPFSKQQMHEPLSAATQFAAMPFAGAVAGWLKEAHAATSLRVVLHRTILRHGKVFLQQTSPYLGDVSFDPLSAGRVLRVNEGILGHAFTHKKVARTRYYADEEELLQELESDMRSKGDDRAVVDVAKAYIAIPITTSSDNVAVVLFADARTPNLFADDKVVQQLVGMCRGFCAAMDMIVDHGPERIRNVAFQNGEPAIAGRDTVYAHIQELVEIPVPQFQKLNTFNFEILS